MDASSTPAQLRRESARDETDVLRQYYLDSDMFMSSEGILKVVSIIGCIVSSAVFLGSGSCGGVAWSGAGVALGAAAAESALCAARAPPLALPLLAPQAYFYTDIIVSSVAGVLLLLAGVLSVAVCENSGAGVLHYVNGPLAMTIAATVMLSAGLTYSAAMRYRDAAWSRRVIVRDLRAPATLAHEHDV